MARMDRRKLLTLIIFALACLGVINFSANCIEKGGHCIMPIYLLLVVGIFNIPAIAFAAVLAVLVWLSLGIFSSRTSMKIVTAFNIVTSICGVTWLIYSREDALQYASATLYVTSFIVFSMVQIFCFICGFKLGSHTDFKYIRTVLTILITFHLSWSFLTSFGVH